MPAGGKLLYKKIVKYVVTWNSIRIVNAIKTRINNSIIIDIYFYLKIFKKTIFYLRNVIISRSAVIKKTANWYMYLN